MAAIEIWKDMVNHDLYGNGQPGLIREIRDFLSQSAGRKKLLHNVGLALGAISTAILLLQQAATVIKQLAH